MTKCKKIFILGATIILTVSYPVYSQSENKDLLIEKSKQELRNSFFSDSLIGVGFKSTGIDETKIMYPYGYSTDDYFRCIASTERDNETFRFVDVVIRKNPLPEFEINSATPEISSYFMDIYFEDLNSIKPVNNRELHIEYMKFIECADSYSNIFLTALETDKPVKIEFKDGTSYVCFVESVSDQTLRNFFVLKNKMGSAKYYEEFKLGVVPGTPRMITDDSEQKGNIGKISFYRACIDSPAKRPGMITNRFTWMGKYYLGIADTVELAGYIDKNQELNLHKIKLLDSNRKYHELFLPDLTAIKTAGFIDNEGLVQSARDKIIHNREITQSLARAWDSDSRLVYIDFRDKPMFKGILAEFIPSYSLSKIVHAVAEGEGGQFAFVRNIDDVNTIYFVQKNDDEIRNMIESQYEQSRKHLIPAEPESFSIKNVKPVMIKSTGSAKTQYELNLNNIGLLSQDKIRVLQIQPPEGDYKYVRLDVDLKIINGKKSAKRQVYFDEFVLFDSNQKFLQYYALLYNNKITDMVEISKTTKVFSIIFFVPSQTRNLYLKFSNLDAVTIQVPE